MTRSVGQTSLSEIARCLSGDGLGLRLGPYEFRVQSRSKIVAGAFRTLHAHRPLREPAEIPDFTLNFHPETRRLRSYLVGMVDGTVWHSWPKRLSVAAMEWITSWCFFRGTWDRLAMHGASAVPPGGDQAIVIPGHSGAGKSTLSSTLMLSGWRLLSDEVALIDSKDCSVTGLGRPTILKGESIELLRQRFGSQAVFGPEGWMKDPPAKIAHLRPTQASVDCSGQSFAIKAFVFPQRDQALTGTASLNRISVDQVFVKLNQMGINYRQLGEFAFQFALDLARRYPAYELLYGDAGDAERLLIDYPYDQVRPREQAHSLLQVTTDQRAIADCSDSASEPSLAAAELKGSRSPEVNSAMVFDVLKQPDRSLQMRSDQWGDFIAMANHLELWPQLAERLIEGISTDHLPPRVRHRLRREQQLNHFHRLAIDFELDELERLMQGVDFPVVLLKGAAYQRADCAWAKGRRSGDVDLLVRESDLDDLQELLQRANYVFDGELDPRDARYFRRWLHEIPPLHHPYRRLQVDVHFRLLPKCDPHSFATESFVERSIPLHEGRLRWLDPIDRVIHGAVNLGHTGEYRRAVRDVWDLNSMIDDSSRAAPYPWETLARRSIELGIEATVARVLLLAEQVSGLDVPEPWTSQLGTSKSKIRSGLVYRTMLHAALPDQGDWRSLRRRRSMWLMEHYPVPKTRTWIDPLTWTKRIKLIHGD